MDVHVERLGYKYFDFSTENPKLVLEVVAMASEDSIVLAGNAEGRCRARVDKIVFVPEKGGTTEGSVSGTASLRTLTLARLAKRPRLGERICRKNSALSVVGVGTVPSLGRGFSLCFGSNGDSPICWCNGDSPSAATQRD